MYRNILYGFVVFYNFCDYMGMYDSYVPLSEIENKILDNANYVSGVLIDESAKLAHFTLNPEFYDHGYITTTKTQSCVISGISDYGDHFNRLFNGRNNGSINNRKTISYGSEHGFFTMCYNIGFAIIILKVIEYVLNVGYFCYCAAYGKNKSNNGNSDNVDTGDLNNKNDNLFKFEIKTPYDNLNKNKFEIAKKSDVMYEDIIGSDTIKTELKEYMKYVKNRDIYNKVGFKPPKGLLFVGPPGTGKTMLAKAFASECDVSFIPVCGSNFIEIYMGSGQKNVKDLFKLARKNTPCVIFIDEIDSIGKRGSENRYSHSEMNSTLNALLTEMDGFESNENILIIGATNIPENLDEAILRSGRFDKRIVFDLPNINERKLMFNYYLDKILVNNDFNKNKDVFIDKLAKMTAGLSGADIKNIINQGISNFMKDQDLDNIKYIFDEHNVKSLYDIQNEKRHVFEMGTSMNDLLKSIDEIIIGMEKRERLLSENERITVAFHEAGHTLVGCLMKHTEPPLKTSIVPRGENALGFAQHEPNDKKLHTESYLLSQIFVLLGGRAAEKLKFNDVTNGASNDFSKATSLAYQMVMKYGMSDDIGPICTTYEDKSEWLKSSIDGQVNSLLKKIQIQVINLLVENKDYLDKLAEMLLEKEVLFNDDVYDIVPFNLRGKYNPLEMII